MIWIWAGAMLVILGGLGLIGLWVFGLYQVDEEAYHQGRHRADD